MSLVRDLRRAVAEWQAGRLLRSLMDTVGAPGLRAAALEPGFAAVVDQHAAAVRDLVRDTGQWGRGGVAVLAPGRTGIDARLRLAAYARGLLDEQRRRGATVALPLNGVWHPQDWMSVRLIAVCQLVARDPGH